MSKIKILHIIKSLGRGGAEVLLPETLKLHNRQQFEFYYIYFLPWKNQMVSSLENLNGKVTCLESKNNIEILTTAGKIIDYCNQYNIDLIHAHLPWSGFLARIVHKRSNIPVIYSEHNIQERYHWATKMLNKISFNNQSLAIGVSQDVTESIMNNISIDIPVKTILNGVNTDKYKRDCTKGRLLRQKYNIPENALVIGNIAVFRKQKDLKCWLEAFTIISNKNPDIYGILVGAGPEEDEIKKIALERNLKTLIFPGLQTDTIPYFSAMDIFMMSSQFEGLPIALLEAMSMECAVVSTKAGGVVEVIREGDCGLLVEVGDYVGLAQRVDKLAQNPESLKKLQRKSRERIITEFSLRKMVSNLEKEYLELAQ